MSILGGPACITQPLSTSKGRQRQRIMYIVSAPTCDDVETPSESCDGDRDLAKASAASTESLLPACEFADVLLLLLSLIVPGNERFFRKLDSKQYGDEVKLQHVIAGQEASADPGCWVRRGCRLW